MKNSLFDRLATKVGASNRLEVCAKAVDQMFPELRGLSRRVNLSSVCGRHGIKVNSVQQAHFDGRFEWQKNEHPTITLYQGLKESKLRFVMAHEMGHWIIQEMLNERHTQLFRGLPISGVEAEEEEELADAIAREIVIPFEDIKHLASEGVSFETLSRAQTYFDAELSTLLLRLAEVCAKNVFYVTIVPCDATDALNATAIIDDGWIAKPDACLMRCNRGVELAQEMKFQSFSTEEANEVSLLCGGRKITGLFAARFDHGFGLLPKVRLLNVGIST